MLCDQCHYALVSTLTRNSLSTPADEPKALFTLRFDRAAIQHAASAIFCYICRAILRTLSRDTFRFSKGPQTLNYGFHYASTAHGNLVETCQLIVDGGGTDTRGSTYHGGIVVDEYRPDPLANFELVKLEEDSDLLDFVGDTLSTSSDSMPSMEFIEMCAEECSTLHEKCRDSSKASDWYPTRLLDLGVVPSKEEPVLQLIVTAESTPQGQYCTLSHSWGKITATKLLRSNIEHFKAGIDESKLPKTFRDAFRVVRAVKTRYIWIDSLCIIQDSREDWSREAEMMAQVYRCGFCNIAATHSLDSDGGLFVRRDHHLITPTFVKISNPPLNGIYCLMDDNLFSDFVDSAHLSTRAWVVQERILSPRVLHFTSELIFWDCRERLCSEQFDLKHVEDTNDRRSEWRIQSKYMTDFSSELSSLAARWDRIVRAYSLANITFPTDRPIAIYGVAKNFETEYPILGEYCAGLWRKDMELQLTWRVWKPLDRHPDGWAPSWSWLSVNGGCVATSWSVPSSFRSGTQNTLVTRLARVVGIVHDLHTSGLERCTKVKIQLRGVLNRAKIIGDGVEASVYTEVGGVVGGLRLDVLDWNSDKESYFITIKKHTHTYTLDNFRIIDAYGLVVQSNGNGNYVRIGMFISVKCLVLDGDDILQDFYHEDWQQTEGKEDYPCDDFDSDLGHLITLE